jgi:hypothetical protein
MAAYKPWYTWTYEKILGAVRWDDLCADLEIKIALVFSWIPMIIMRHRENCTHVEGTSPFPQGIMIFIRWLASIAKGYNKSV